MEGVDLSEPIGRKTVKRTLENLKAYVSLKSNLFKAEEKYFLKMLEEIKRDIDESERSKKDLDFINVVLDYSSSASDLIRALQLYIEALETYVSELDETFDSLLEDARKISEQAAREASRDKPSFYG